MTADRVMICRLRSPDERVMYFIGGMRDGVLVPCARDRHHSLWWLYTREDAAVFARDEAAALLLLLGDVLSEWREGVGERRSRIWAEATSG